MPLISNYESSTASCSMAPASRSSGAYSDRSVVTSLFLVLAACAILYADSASVPGRLNIARSSHQATLLADGAVVAEGTPVKVQGLGTVPWAAKRTAAFEA